MTTHALAPSGNKFLNPALWTVQLLLAAFFVLTAFSKLATPAAELAQSIPWTAEYPGLVMLTALVDLLGGLGILLPALTRVMPRLTPLAAIGLIVLQVMAAAFHLSRGEVAVVPLNVVLIALVGFVLWGRTRARPIAPRA